MFENYVNYAGSKTKIVSINAFSPFENYVNYAGSKSTATRPIVLNGLRTMKII